MAKIQSKMFITGITRGVMEGNPWCRVHQTEAFEVQNQDTLGHRAADTRGSHDLIEQVRAARIELPFLCDVEGELTVTKKGATFRVDRIIPPNRNVQQPQGNLQPQQPRPG